MDINIISKFKHRSRWRGILAVCRKPASLVAMSTCHGEKTYSKTRTWILAQQFVEWGFLEKIYQDKLPRYVITKNGLRILEKWKVPQTLQELMDDNVQLKGDEDGNP